MLLRSDQKKAPTRNCKRRVRYCITPKRFKQSMQFIFRKLIGLHAIRKSHDIHLKDSSPKPIRNSFRRSPAGFITIEHHDDMPEMFSE